MRVISYCGQQRFSDGIVKWVSYYRLNGGVCIHQLPSAKLVVVPCTGLPETSLAEVLYTTLSMNAMTIAMWNHTGELKESPSCELF